MSAEHATAKTVRDWLWLLVKVVASGVLLAICAAWLKDNVAPSARWFVYPAFLLIFLALAIPVVFRVRPKSLRRKSRSSH